MQSSTQSAEKSSTENNFPVDHLSASSIIAFCTNPVLFKVRYINRDSWDTTQSISSIMGRAMHNGLEAYYGGEELKFADTEAEAITKALETATTFLEEFPENFIRFTTTVPNKQKAVELVVFAVNSYCKEHKYDPSSVIAVEDEVLEAIRVEHGGQKLNLPIPIKAYIDRVNLEKSELKLIDYKLVSSFSDPERIDGAKIIQSVTYYLAAFAKYKQAPHSLTYEEVKTSKNRDGSPQVRRYEIIFAENPQYFDLFFRVYEDVIRGLNGEMVYPPNLHALYDNEVAIIAYIHRLDEPEERAKAMKQHQVTTLTDILCAEIANAGNMKKLLKAAEKIIVTAKSLNYSQMQPHEKIQKKLLEHGIIVQHQDTISGASVDLFRYNPTIGVKMSKLKSYGADIEQVLGVSGVRILAPIPNSTFIGFEVPRADRRYPALPKNNPSNPLEIMIGEDILGKSYNFNLVDAPHLLVAGASGSGKSVFLGNLISQLLGRNNVELHLFDPKQIELSQYSDGARQYADNPEDILKGLNELIVEMNRRYKMMKENNLKNIESLAPRKVVVIDEFGELMSNSLKVDTPASKDSEGNIKTKAVSIGGLIQDSVLRLAQMARAAGIHLVIATQRPSVDVITGTIKANFPTKAVFKTSKEIDSYVVMDDSGAEKLLGKGDIIFVAPEGNVRLQAYSPIG